MKKKQKRGRATPLAPADPDVLNSEGAAEMLGVSKRLVVRLAGQDRIPGRKVGKEWRFRRTEILRWLSEPDLDRDVNSLLQDPRVKLRARK